MDEEKEMFDFEKFPTVSDSDDVSKNNMNINETQIKNISKNNQMVWWLINEMSSSFKLTSSNYSDDTSFTRMKTATMNYQEINNKKLSNVNNNENDIVVNDYDKTKEEKEINEKFEEEEKSSTESKLELELENNEENKLNQKFLLDLLEQNQKDKKRFKQRFRRMFQFDNLRCLQIRRHDSVDDANEYGWSIKLIHLVQTEQNKYNLYEIMLENFWKCYAEPFIELLDQKTLKVTFYREKNRNKFLQKLCIPIPDENDSWILHCDLGFFKVQIEDN